MSIAPPDKPQTTRKAFRFRLEPTLEQRAVLVRHAGLRRWAYNYGLARRKKHYDATGKTLAVTEIEREIKEMKSGSARWLSELDSQVPQQALRDLQQAYINFFEGRARFPKFHSKKKHRGTFRIPQRVRIEGSRVYCPKVGWVRLRKSRQIEGEIKSATFKESATGKWYVTVVCEVCVADARRPAPDPEHVVGLDAGLKDFVVSSDDERVKTPKFHRRAGRKLKRANRALSRKKRGSRNQAKARWKLAAVHEKVANKRADFLHKLSSRIVAESDVVCVEDLNIEGLARTKLARSFRDAAHGEFRRQLRYKSEWSAKPLVEVGRFFPSSKTCSECLTINHDLGLCERVWECPACRVMLDRDLNAAVNIRREGLRLLSEHHSYDEDHDAAGHAESENACGETVGPYIRARPDGARIPRL